MVRIMGLGRRSAANVRSSCNSSSHVCRTSLDLAAAPREGGCGGNALLRLAGTKSERLDLVYAREPLMHLRGDTFPTDRALPPHSLQRLGQRLAAEALRPSSCVSSPMAKYASCSRAHASQKGIPRISTSARPRQGLSVLLRTWQDPDVLGAWVKSTFLLRARDLLLVIRTPLVSAPATNRVRTLRKDISSIETPIATVGQVYDGRPVRPRCRLLRFLFGGVGLGLHRYSLPWV